MLVKMQADVDNSGTIDYGEFIAATLHLNKVEKEDHLFAAFSYFDKDGSGYITHDELQQACEEFGIDSIHLDEMIKDADQNNVSASLTYAFIWREKNKEISFINELLNFSGRPHRLQWVCGHDAERKQWFG